MRLLISFLLLSLLVSCGSAAVFDYEQTADFSKFKSYNFYPSIESGLSPLDGKRIETTLDSLLATKGLVKSEQPDILINYYAAEQLVNANTIGVGVGGGGGNVGVGVGGGIPIGGKKVEQQFTLDFIDARQDALIWQGALNKAYSQKANPQQKQTHYLKLLQKLLKGYPPK